MTKARDIETRWWGWGDIKKTFAIEDRPDLVPYLEERLGIKVEKLREPDPTLDEVELRESRLTGKQVKKLEGVVGPEHVKTGKKDRVYHGLGKSYRDLLRGHMRQVPNPPDAVVFPDNEDEVAKLLRLAESEKIAVVPFCGGSSVVGGVEPLDGEGLVASISMDLRRIDRLISVDAESRVATFEAGIWGPQIDEALATRNLYLGHQPESFMFSGLGGWIASRGAGRQSTSYGKIEHMIEGVRMVTPRGVIDTVAVPATAAGPDMRQVIAGSEGTLGVITKATMKVHPLPQIYDYRGLLFKEFEGGVQAVREMLQKGLFPECIRVSDTEESKLASFIRKPSSNPVKEGAIQAAFKAMGAMGYSFETGAFAILGCEGKKVDVSGRMKQMQSICRKNGALPLGRMAGEEWYKGRYDNPYFRDLLMNWGVMIDTLETATNWDNVMTLYRSVKKAISQALEDYNSPSIVTCHLSHSYVNGSSLYFIFLGRNVPGKEIEQWEHLKKMAGEAILASGGTITHHHGVGYEHAPWFKEEVGPEALEALKALKASCDPAGIMNPGKLGL